MRITVKEAGLDCAFWLVNPYSEFLMKANEIIAS